MNAIALLKAQHREVEDLFQKLEDAPSRSKESVAEKILRELTIHTAIEEQVFYPSVRKLVAATGELVLESLEEHNVVKWEIASIAMMEAKNERFEAKMKVLKDLVMHHVEEEENQLFPAVQKALGAAKLNEIGDQLEKAREAVTRGRGRPQERAQAASAPKASAGATAQRRNYRGARGQSGARRAAQGAAPAAPKPSKRGARARAR